jgi:hypothetical protein
MVDNDNVRIENLMAATWTKAAKVRRVLKAGRQRQKDLAYDTERAVIECRLLFNRIRAEMLEAGITTVEDVRVALVLMTLREVYLFQVPRDFSRLPTMYEQAAILERNENAVPVGAAIWQRDPEAGDSVEVWVQPWLVNPRAVLAAAEARKAFLDSDGRDTKSAF